jgi:hypothetical protein
VGGDSRSTAAQKAASSAETLAALVQQFKVTD